MTAPKPPVVLRLSREEALALHAALCEAVSRAEAADDDRWVVQRLRDMRRRVEAVLWRHADRTQP